MKVHYKVQKFDWDKGNIGKNRKHNIENKEAEEPFFDKNKIIHKDVLHSKTEARYILIGKTNKDRLLYIVFTKRAGKLRIISVRGVNKKEVYLYEKTT